MIEWVFNAHIINGGSSHEKNTIGLNRFDTIQFPLNSLSSGKDLNLIDE